jgi:hypothetical protein
MKIIQNTDGYGWDYEVHPFTEMDGEPSPLAHGIEVNVESRQFRVGWTSYTLSQAQAMVAAWQKAIALAIVQEGQGEG